eukprot:8214701-Pyramimonas_sp.AAC.1
MDSTSLDCGGNQIGKGQSWVIGGERVYQVVWRPNRIVYIETFCAEPSSARSFLAFTRRGLT